MGIDQLISSAGISSGEIFSIHDVAAILRCSVRTVQRLIKQGRLKAFHRGRCIIGIGQDALSDFLENGATSDITRCRRRGGGNQRRGVPNRLI